MAEPLSFKAAMEFAYGEPRELSPGVVRFVANNPSPYTYKGTNSYLIGTRSLALIDPGPEDAPHLAAIMKAAGDRKITHIVLTHTHRDHIDGLPAALKATGAKTAGFGSYPLVSEVAERTGPGGEGSHTDRNWQPDIVLKDGGRLQGEDWALDAIHTPGHTPDHLAFSLSQPGGLPDVLFTGDHIMAWNTSVIAPPEGRLGDYLESLEKIMSRTETVAYPGHGGQFDNPARVARAYLVHRRMRDASILECIKGGVDSVDGVVAQVYRGLDERLIGAAALSVLAHVEHLSERALIRASSPLSRSSVLSAV
ncbi:MAG: MBL fold metallo-hydrolase [Hyphomicrobiaceae bacterium]|nr:MBL fold metallo-hydrolase [Hyphomicrobiaceae bacterium]